MRKVINRNGQEVILRNPREKGEKYCAELHAKVNVSTGEVLRPTQLAYRSGYVESRKDSAKAYCHNNGTKYQAGKKAGTIKSRVAKLFGRTQSVSAKPLMLNAPYQVSSCDIKVSKKPRSRKSK